MAKRKYATAEEQVAAAKLRRDSEREAIQANLAEVIANKHVHAATVSVTVTVEKPIKKRIRAMFWRCKCGAAFDGNYWYRREDA